MSAKYANKKKTPLGVIALVIILAAVCAALIFLLTVPEDQPAAPEHTAASDPTTETTAHTAAASGTEPEGENSTHPAPETKPVRVDALEEVSIDLGSGMRITDVGKYTGVYMEDGSDELVSGVMMIAVTNEGENAVQYAEITLPVGGKTAEFSLTTLPVGSTVILLEKNRLEYVPGDYTVATVSNVALFSGPLSLCEDKLELQILDGAISITNISGADIDGDIVIYYKNSAADVYYGGITYRVRLEGGMRADEVRQIMASHFSSTGSAIMFVTCGGV